MESNEMKQLLERYWMGQTTLEEEALLRAWFSRGPCPGASRADAAWFVYLNSQRPVVKARRLSLRARFMPLCKSAAVVVLIASLGPVMQHTLEPQAGSIARADTIGRQITAPSVALSAFRMKIRLQEQHVQDSLLKNRK